MSSGARRCLIRDGSCEHDPSRGACRRCGGVPHAHGSLPGRASGARYRMPRLAPGTRGTSCRRRCSPPGVRCGGSRDAPRHVPWLYPVRDQPLPQRAARRARARRGACPTASRPPRATSSRSTSSRSRTRCSTGSRTPRRDRPRVSTRRSSLAFVTGLQRPARAAAGRARPGRRARLQRARRRPRSSTTSETGVNSALPRARAAIEHRGGTREAAALPASAVARRLAARFADAFLAGDVDGVVALLRPRARLTMPPPSRSSTRGARRSATSSRATSGGAETAYASCPTRATAQPRARAGTSPKRRPPRRP